jgi:cytidine deaminase
MRKPEALNYLKTIVKKAYTPYSNFKVAAIVEDSEGNFTFGVNVENASYGLTSCAERNAMFSFIANGYKTPVNLYLYTETEDFTPPCGACRQVLVEFATKLNIVVFNKNGDYKTFTVDELLPEAFNKENLNKQR